jgi:hypothetical protein
MVYIREDRTFHEYRCENLKFYILFKKCFQKSWSLASKEKPKFVVGFRATSLPVYFSNICLDGFWKASQDIG